MDRREQTRACKESPRTKGVFRVRNATNGKSLIGSSVDLPAMLNHQRGRACYSSRGRRLRTREGGLRR